MVGGIITIVLGLVIAIAGPTAGVIVSRRGERGRTRSARVAGNSAIGIGVLIIIFGIYQVATSA